MRFGDPETEVLVPLYGDELFELLLAAPPRVDSTGARRGAAAPRSPSCWRPRATPRVRARATSSTDSVADGQLHEHARASSSFTPATLAQRGGRFITRGGRVLAVTGLGPTVAEARRRAYEGAGLHNL